MGLASLTRPELIFPDLDASDGTAVLKTCAEKAAEQGLVASAGELYARLMEREQLGSTGIGSGVAIPHCKMEGLERAVLVVAKVDRAIDFGAVDGQPVRLFFLVISPHQTPAEHLQALAAISRWVKADRHVEKMLELSDRGAMYQLLTQGEG